MWGNFFINQAGLAYGVLFFRRSTFKLWGFNKVKKAEFQKLHGFSDADMKLIDYTLKLFGGKIVAIF